MFDDATPSRTLLNAGLVLCLLLSGCMGAAGPEETEDTNQTDAIEPGSEEPEDASAEDGNESAPEQRETEDETSTSENTTAGNETADADDQAAEEPEPRTVEHAAGETTIEGETSRVVALEFLHVENVLGLGMQPAGVADKDGYEKWVDAGIELDASVQDVGTRAEPNLEEIADLEPDLILAVEFRHAEIYDDLSKIAPTLLFEAFPESNASDDQFDRMVSIFDRTGTATAREDQGTEVLDGMNEHFERVRAHLEEEGLTGREVLMSQLFTYEGQPLARVFLDNSIAVNVAERIGLENAWNKEACSTGYGYCDVNKEGFVDVQHADFFYQAQPNDDPVQDEWSDDPVWNSYEFVQEDRVYPLGAKAWLFGGPLVTQEIADRMAEHYLR